MHDKQALLALNPAYYKPLFGIEYADFLILL